jgi:hypothetical protein
MLAILADQLLGNIEDLFSYEGRTA